MSLLKDTIKRDVVRHFEYRTDMPVIVDISFRKTAITCTLQNITFRRHLAFKFHISICRYRIDRNRFNSKDSCNT